MAKVLVVDDNRSSRILLLQLITSYGLEIIEAADGSECLKMVNEQRPDLILIDMQMPVMDGYTVMKALKKNHETRDIPIIAVTSFAMKGDREKAFEAGADDYISKPVDIKQLISRMRKYVEIDEGTSV